MSCSDSPHVIHRSALALAATLTVVSIRPASVVREWEDKTASERKTRQEAAVKKEAEMKAAAAAALAEHRAQREKAAADTLAANKAAEEAEAAEAAGETNPWKTICALPTFRQTTRALFLARWLTVRMRMPSSRQDG